MYTGTPPVDISSRAAATSGRTAVKSRRAALQAPGVPVDSPWLGAYSFAPFYDQCTLLFLARFAAQDMARRNPK